MLKLASRGDATLPISPKNESLVSQLGANQALYEWNQWKHFLKIIQNFKNAKLWTTIFPDIMESNCTMLSTPAAIASQLLTRCRCNFWKTRWSRALSEIKWWKDLPITTASFEALHLSHQKWFFDCQLYFRSSTVKKTNVSSRRLRFQASWNNWLTFYAKNAIQSIFRTHSLATTTTSTLTPPTFPGTTDCLENIFRKFNFNKATNAVQLGN